jgi:hypothetical protein
VRRYAVRRRADDLDLTNSTYSASDVTLRDLSVRVPLYLLETINRPVGLPRPATIKRERLVGTCAARRLSTTAENWTTVDRAEVVQFSTAVDTAQCAKRHRASGDAARTASTTSEFGYRSPRSSWADARKPKGGLTTG